MCGGAAVAGEKSVGEKGEGTGVLSALRTTSFSLSGEVSVTTPLTSLRRSQERKLLV